MVIIHDDGELPPDVPVDGALSPPQVLLLLLGLSAETPPVCVLEPFVLAVIPSKRLHLHSCAEETPDLLESSHPHVFLPPILLLKYHLALPLTTSHLPKLLFIFLPAMIQHHGSVLFVAPSLHCYLVAIF